MNDQANALAENDVDCAMLASRAQRAAQQSEINSICDLIGVVSEPDRSVFAAALGCIADAYLLDLDVAPHYGRPKEQRSALRALRKSVGETIDRMGLIAAEYAVQLDMMLSASELQRYRDQSLTQEAQTLLALLELAIDRFDRNYVPNRGRPADVPLEEAVRSLIDLIDDATGQKPIVKHNKTTGAAPELSSPQAKAIGMLLMAINTSLTETAVANMIEKVTNNPVSSESHLEAIWRSDPDCDLDLSLLPNRNRD